MMPQTRQVPSPAASSSQVLQVPDDQSAIRLSGTLRLRGDDSNSSGINTGSVPNRHIRWGQDVVDNEGMGKKSSKVCCIYHKPRPVGESSSESESSDSDSDSDSEANRHQNRPNRSQRHLGQRESSHNRHSSQEDSEKGHTACCTKHHGKQGKQRKPSPNAYERMPKPPKGHLKSQGA